MQQLHTFKDVDILKKDLLKLKTGHQNGLEDHTEIPLLSTSIKKLSQLMIQVRHAGSVLVWRIFSYHRLVPLVQTEYCC